jgi:hypothetical protein
LLVSPAIVIDSGDDPHQTLRPRRPFHNTVHPFRLRSKKQNGRAKGENATATDGKIPSAVVNVNKKKQTDDRPGHDISSAPRLPPDANSLSQESRPRLTHRKRLHGQQS